MFPLTKISEAGAYTILLQSLNNSSETENSQEIKQCLIIDASSSIILKKNTSAQSIKRLMIMIIPIENLCFGLNIILKVNLIQNSNIPEADEDVNY
jgi:hypothetical protein